MTAWHLVNLRLDSSRGIWLRRNAWYEEYEGGGDVIAGNRHFCAIFPVTWKTEPRDKPNNAGSREILPAASPCPIE